jgi:FixJ family two-component response regulator
MVLNQAKEADRTLSASVSVVDGDHGIRNSLRVLLRTLDIPVLTFSTAEEFLARLSSGVPTFLITELRLPGITGFQLKEVMDHRGIKIPVLGLTDRITADDRERALQLGFVDLVEKPFVYRSVVERVQQAIEMSPSPGKAV